MSYNNAGSLGEAVTSPEKVYLNRVKMFWTDKQRIAAIGIVRTVASLTSALLNTYTPRLPHRQSKRRRRIATQIGRIDKEERIILRVSELTSTLLTTISSPSNIA